MVFLYKGMMPELPEVETVARDLRLVLVGRTLVGLTRSRKALRQSWSKAWEAKLLGRRVAAVHRRGKWLLVELSESAYLMVHLGMTGRFTVVTPETESEPHTHLVFRLDNTHELRFRDPRRFGSVTFFPDRPSWEAYLASRLGPEPWDLKPKEFQAALRQTSRSLKAVLLDQTVIAGVGNIYADESCFAARLDPRRVGSAVQPAEATRLLTAIQRILRKAIENRGTSFDGFYSGGNHQNKLNAYGRTGEPCVRCGTAIECVRLAGRSTHYCPKCQK
jgi:formamidopyrimidine-DNA glycosylase